jgi:hypothetical protein
MSNGKGSNPRPFSVDQTIFTNNWERIFGMKNDKCAYSGLPSTSSYDNVSDEEYTSAVERLKQQEQLKRFISELEDRG